MKTWMLGLALIVAMPPGSLAQSADPATRELIEKLLARIDTLEKRVAQLEKGGAPSAVAAAPTPAPVVPGPHAHDQAAVPSPAAAEAADTVYPLLKLSGFGNLDFGATNVRGSTAGFGSQSLVNQHSGFQLGQF